MENSEVPPLCTFLKLYFDYAYFFCLSPFRFVKKKDKPKFVLQSWLPQKILCGIFHLVSLHLLLRDLYSKVIVPPEAYSGHPAKYFHLGDSIFNLAYKLTLIKRLWWNPTHFCDVMDYIGSQKCLRLTKFAFFKNVHTHIILLFYTFVGFTSLVAGKNFVSSINDWSLSAWYRKLISYGCKTFFVNLIYDCNHAKAHSDAELDVNLILETALAIFTSVGLLARFLLGFFIDMCILIMTITLWTAAVSFTTTIYFDPFEKWTFQNQPGLVSEKLFVANEWLRVNKITSVKPIQSMPPNWESIYRNFEAIQMLSKLVNEAMGSLVVWFVFEALMYYSVNMDAFLITKDMFKRSYLLAYYLGTISIFSLSAHITITLETIKTWLEDDGERSVIPYEDYNLILHEMTEKEIGIRGIGAFTITYTLFASFVGTVVTFFIICLDQKKA